MLVPARRAWTVCCDRQSLFVASQICTRASHLQHCIPPSDRCLRNVGRTLPTTQARYYRPPQTNKRHGTLNSPKANNNYDFASFVSFKPIAELFSLYKSLPGAQRSRLEPSTMRSLSERLLFTITRSRGASADTAEVVAFVQRLATDMKNGKVTRTPQACHRVLTIYRETNNAEAFHEWWDWLRVQDNESGTVSTHAYTAAIGFLAEQNTSLVELEALYAEALARWPADFQEYHMSANAVLPDRDQPFKNPMHLNLLHGIAKARRRNGSAKEAYLALDTLFRLAPSEPFLLTVRDFIATRPLPEAVTIHAMACRGGQPIGLYHGRNLIRRMIDNALNSPTKFGSILAVRQILSLVYLEIGAGSMAQHKEGWVDLTVRAVTSVMKVPGVLLLPEDERQALVDGVFTCIRKVLETFGSLGFKPSAESFNQIIADVAGLGRSKEVIRVALSDASKLELESNHFTMRAILIAAGRIGDASLVKESWNGVVELKEAKNETVNEGDIHSLVKAAQQSGLGDFAREVLEQTKDKLPAQSVAAIIEHMDNPLPDPARTGDVPDIKAYAPLLETLQADLEVFEQRLKSRKIPVSFKDQDLPTRFRRPLPEESVPEADLRRIYDEMSQDPSQQPSSKPKAPARSPTDITFGDLRFENWKDINFLIAQAMKNDAAYEDAVDAAIAAGTSTPTRWDVYKEAEVLDDTVYGLSDLPLSPAEPAATDPGQLEKLRQEIFSLRGVVPAQQRHAATV